MNKTISYSLGWKEALGALLFFYVLAAFFWQYPTANSIPRVGMAIRMVENRVLDLDVYGKMTIDKALIGGRFYNDKAPLSTLLLLPGYAVAHALGKTPTADPLSRLNYANRLALRLVNYPLFAICCVLLLFSLLRKGIPYWQAAGLFTAASFGTYIFPMLSNYFGHHIAGALLFFSYLCFRKRDRRSLFYSGLFLGLSFAAEYTAYLFGISAAIVLFWEKRWKSIPDTTAIVIGALPGIALVIANNWLITGSPLKFAYEFEALTQFQAMSTHLGFRVPSAKAAWELIFGQYRGMLFYAPFLLVGLPALLLGVKQDGRRTGVVVLLAVLWLLFVSMFYLWSGGAAYGPRYLIPISFILFYEAAHAILRRGWMPAGIALGAAGLLMAVAAQTTTAIIAEDKSAPLFDLVLPSVLAGEGPLWGDNWGSLLGLLPFPTMLLWLGLFAAGMVAMGFWFQRKPNAR